MSEAGPGTTCWVGGTLRTGRARQAVADDVSMTVTATTGHSHHSPLTLLLAGLAGRLGEDRLQFLLRLPPSRHPEKTGSSFRIEPASVHEDTRGASSVPTAPSAAPGSRPGLPGVCEHSDQ